MVPETLEQNKPLSSTDSVGVFVCISIVITVFTFEASALEKKNSQRVAFGTRPHPKMSFPHLGGSKLAYLGATAS